MLGSLITPEIGSPSPLVLEPLMQRWLTPDETAEYLGLTRQAIYHRISRGTLPTSRMGRRVWIDRVAVDRTLTNAKRSRRSSKKIPTPA